MYQRFPKCAPCRRPGNPGLKIYTIIVKLFIRIFSIYFYLKIKQNHQFYQGYHEKISVSEERRETNMFGNRWYTLYIASSTELAKISDHSRLNYT